MVATDAKQHRKGRCNQCQRSALETLVHVNNRYIWVLFCKRCDSPPSGKDPTGKPYGPERTW